MSFRVLGVAPEPFFRLFERDDEALAQRNARRVVVTDHPGYPDRIALEDAQRGETLFLVNDVHQPAATPYRASHAIFVRPSSRRRFDAVDVAPEALRIRTLSLPAFDADHMMLDAEMVEGARLAEAVEGLFHYRAAPCIHVR